MECFNVYGTTVLTWTVQVQAHNEGEALKEAQRIADWIDIPSSLVTVHGKEHRIAGCRPIDSAVG